jgi:hypothetical protein
VQQDFDAVIFAMGRDEFGAVLNRHGHTDTGARTIPKPWTGLADRGQTVATKSAQVWLTRDLEELGWYRGSGIISALGLSFDTWADMTHTLASERAWQRAKTQETGEADRARSVAYFCGVIPGETPDNGPHNATVGQDLETLLGEMGTLWPDAFKDGQTAHALVVDRHVQANTEGSDRYSLSLPGSIQHRLSPLDRTVLNASVAGDWTACGLDAGCVEAAVMSGMLAAHAITGDEPRLESIVGYDHP